MRRLLSLTLALAAFGCAAAPAAHGAWFAAEPLDGPNAEVLALGGVDLATDGGGALAYVRRDGVWLSRLTAGALGPPVRVDPGGPGPASDAAVAVADGGRLAVVWTVGADLYGAFTAEDGSGARSGATLLYRSPGGGALSGLDLDMGINGTAFAVFSAPGAGGADVLAVRLQGATWEGVPGPLDLGPGAAGDGASRPSVAVAADGNAVVAWGEEPGDGRRRVYARRITRLVPSTVPQEASVPNLGPVPAGGADSPDVSIEYDNSFAWVVWRQDAGGASRSLGRRLVGSTFDPLAFDAGPGTTAPRVAVSGRGDGIAAAAAPGAVAVGSVLDRDAFTPLQAFGGAGVAAADPVVGVSERDSEAVAWRQAGADASAGLVGRFRPADEAFEAPTIISNAGLGAVPAGAYDLSSDRLGDVAVAMIQAGPAGRSVALAVSDRPPGAPRALGSGRYERRSRPVFRWQAAAELWGQQFKVLVDGVEVGTTADPRTLTAATPLAQGVHRWQVVAVDRRGQQASSRVRTIRIDSVAPRLRARVARSGRLVSVRVSGSDPKGSGLKYVQTNWGDGARRTRRSRAAHRYRAGRFTLRVKAVDKAGNVATRSVRLRFG